MSKAQEVDCPTCKGNGWVMYVYPEKKPRPAHWFNRGPKGERPSECPDCEDLPGDD